jgi:hypothetical protein
MCHHAAMKASNKCHTAPRRSIIITPSTPLCDEIRAIVSSISAMVDDSMASGEIIVLCRLRERQYGTTIPRLRGAREAPRPGPGARKKERGKSKSAHGSLVRFSYVTVVSSNYFDVQTSSTCSGSCLCVCVLFVSIFLFFDLRQRRGDL